MRERRGRVAECAARGKRGSIVVSLRPKSQANKTKIIMGDGGGVQQTEREAGFEAESSRLGISITSRSPGEWFELEVFAESSLVIQQLQVVRNFLHPDDHQVSCERVVRQVTPASSPCPFILHASTLPGGVLPGSLD